MSPSLPRIRRRGSGDDDPPRTTSSPSGGSNDEQPTNEPPKGPTVYAEYIKEQVAAQDARKASFEQRGLAVITTSGALVTLLFGLTALTIAREPTYDIPNTAALFLLLALVFFVLAALSALITNLPRGYQAVKVSELAGVVTKKWNDNEATALRTVARTRLDVLAAAKGVNNQKSKALTTGMTLEIIAVALVGIAMGIVLWD